MAAYGDPEQDRRHDGSGVYRWLNMRMVRPSPSMSPCRHRIRAIRRTDLRWVNEGCRTVDYIAMAGLEDYVERVSPSWKGALVGMCEYRCS